MTIISILAQGLLFFIDDDFVFSIFGHRSKSSGKATGMLSEEKAWVSITVIFLFTLLTIRIVQKTRRDAKVALESYYQDMSKYKDHECLKARTLHIEGVIPADRTGDGVKRHLNNILRQKSYGTQ